MDSEGVILQIGSRGDLGERGAIEAAAEWRRIANARPAFIMPCIAGYDEDPKEIWDIPEAAAYVRLWAELSEIHFESTKGLLHESALGFLAACGCFGDDVDVMVPPAVSEQ